MKTTSKEFATLKSLLSLTEREFRRFHRIWETAKILDVDSRFIERDGLFLAQKGKVMDGHRFILEILGKGGWVLVEPSYPRQSSAQEKRIVRIPNLSDMTGKLGALFYHYPSQRLRVVGITGTDGKTSTARILAEAYYRWGQKTAVIGTLGVSIVNHPNTNVPHQNTPNTTPDPVILQRIFYSLRRRGVDTVVMEVSSHGITLGRVQEVAFDSGVWTNLSSEHLDYHVTLENYARTKSRLFELLRHSPKKNKHGVISLDSFLKFSEKKKLPWVKEIMGRIEPQIESYPLSFFCLKEWAPQVTKVLSPRIRQWVTTYTSRPAKLCQEVIINTGKNLGGRKKIISTGLIGQFNAQNLTAAFLEGEHYRREVSPSPSWSAVKKSWKQIKVKGRLEEFLLNKSRHSRHPNFKILKKCRLYIDYAHTPQALEKTLIALRDSWNSKILCVFGCGGDRDMVKREPMGGVACRLANISIITDDNPRTEDPEQIRQAIVIGWHEEYSRLSKTEKAERKMELIPGREKAIARALEIIPSGGVILLTGKGHEDYQIVGKKKYRFDEREVLRDILSNPNQS